MNVIFLNFDGVLNTIHYSKPEDIERRIKTLGQICKKYDCKVVIEAAAKDAIDEENMEIESAWVKSIFDLFKKYEIECIGRTPNVRKYYGSHKSSYISMWKEDEIRLYLYRHPEIEHYCIIDDDDFSPRNSDLNKVRNHLVKTIYYSDNPEEEGLLDKHIDQIGTALNEENEVKRLILKRKKK